MEEQLQNLTLDDELQWIKDEVLDKQLEIGLTDTRTIQGRLICVDHLGNCVLAESQETIPNHNGITRNLGQIIVPKKAISYIHISS